MFCSYLLTLSICCLVPRQVVRGGWLMFFSAENSCLLRLTTKTETVELWPRKPKQSTHCCKKMLHRTEPQSWMLLLWWFNFIFCKTVRGKAKSNFEKQACWHPYLLLPLVSAAVFPLHVTFDLKLIQNWANWLIGQHRGRQMCSWLAMRWAACLQFFCCIETLHKKTKKQIIELIFHSPLLLSSLFVSSFLLPSPSHRKCPVLSCPVLSCPVLARLWSTQRTSSTSHLGHPAPQLLWQASQPNICQPEHCWDGGCGVGDVGGRGEGTRQTEAQKGK